LIDWWQPSKRQEFSDEMRALISRAQTDAMARLQLYRRMGYSWERLKQLGILTDEMIDDVAR